MACKRSGVRAPLSPPILRFFRVRGLPVRALPGGGAASRRGKARTASAHSQTGRGRFETRPLVSTNSSMFKLRLRWESEDTHGTIEMMERKIQSFRGHADADRADREYYLSLKPSERVALLLELMRAYYGPPRRLERVLRAVEPTRG